MGNKNKRKHPDVEEILARPWCYYCERDFDDQKVLINHQKAKHFKCERCGRRLNTAGGLSVHMTQVHKETLTAIENALPNRSNLDVEIFGMEGIPADIVASHNQRVLTQFAQAEAERRAATGNPAPGAAGSGAKKPKFESPGELKKRLAEHKAKVAAEEAAGISSGNGTPVGAGQESFSPAVGGPPGFSGPQYPPQQASYGPPGSTNAYPPPYSQAPNQFQPQPSFSQQPPGYGSPGPNFPPQQHTYGPPPQFSPPVDPNFATPQFHTGPTRTFGAGSPALPFQQQGQFQPPRTQTPPQSIQRTPSLPAAPGLPMRPSFGAPPVNAFQMQQLHQGQPAPPTPQVYSNQQSNAPFGNGPDVKQNGRGSPYQQPNYNNGSFAGVQQQGPFAQPLQPFVSPPVLEQFPPAAAFNLVSAITSAQDAKPEEKKSDAPAEKKSKKDKEKDRGTKMVYVDNEISPEEKMAGFSRYASP